MQRRGKEDAQGSCRQTSLQDLFLSVIINWKIMLRLSEIRDAYERSTSKLGEINRQLCFAGFAVVWIFNRTSEVGAEGLSIPAPLYLAVFLWCVSMILDILQYVSKTAIWYFYYLKQLDKHRDECSKNGEEESEDDCIVDEPEHVNAVIWAFFILKVLTMFAGYIVLGIFLISQI